MSGERLKGIAWLRWYCAFQWEPVKPDEDYRIFGQLRLGHLRDAVADADRMREAADALLARVVAAGVFRNVEEVPEVIALRAAVREQELR
jgi:hypothetical protein